MTTYNQNTFRELILSNAPEKIDEGMELLQSIHPQTIEEFFAEVGWEVIDEEAFWERLEEHAYLTLYLLGVMYEFEVEWVVELEDLEIVDMELSRLPDIIGNLTNIKTLDLSDNPFTTLPESFGNLTHLTYLMLDSNQFTTLPESFENLPNLNELSLYDNQFTTLPDWIGNLTNLTYLYLLSNRISESERARIQALLPNCDIEF